MADICTGKIDWAKMNIEQLKQGQQITIEGDILDVKAWQYQIY